jgi:chemotaxis response regulator CheB
VRVQAEGGVTILPDAVRAYEQELVQKADVLALGLQGLRAAAPERAAALLETIVARLGVAAGASASVGAAQASPLPELRTVAEQRRVAPVVIAARSGGADEVEDFILDLLAENPPGLSVQDLVDSLDAAQIDIKRKTLVVRLHRMVHAGRIAPQAHGHYSLSDAERSRRRA